MVSTTNLFVAASSLCVTHPPRTLQLSGSGSNVFASRSAVLMSAIPDGSKPPRILQPNTFMDDPITGAGINRANITAATEEIKQLFHTNAVIRKLSDVIRQTPQWSMLPIEASNTSFTFDAFNAEKTQSEQVVLDWLKNCAVINAFASSTLGNTPGQSQDFSWIMDIYTGQLNAASIKFFERVAENQQTNYICDPRICEAESLERAELIKQINQAENELLLANFKEITELPGADSFKFVRDLTLYSFPKLRAFPASLDGHFHRLEIWHTDNLDLTSGAILCRDGTQWNQYPGYVYAPGWYNKFVTETGRIAQRGAYPDQLGL